MTTTTAKMIKESTLYQSSPDENIPQKVISPARIETPIADILFRPKKPKNKDTMTAIIPNIKSNPTTPQRKIIFGRYIG